MCGILTERINDFLMSDSEAYAVFASVTRLLRYDGTRKTSNGHEMALGTHITQVYVYSFVN